MPIRLIKDLVGTEPVRIDQRTRNADGTLKYPEQQKKARVTTLVRVWIDKNREKDGHDWLMWEWERHVETPHCNYSGITLDHTEIDNYALMVYDRGGTK